MTETTKRYLSNFDAGDQEENNPKIMRIILGEQHVQIDFGYAAESIYFRGGWIRIAPYTYLQVKGSKIKYKLLDAKNIPIKPEHLHFESKQDWQVFSLFFEAIPLKKCVIAIIEEEKPSSTDFNFYDIKLLDFINTI